jgi:hypothetical protein
MVQKPTLCNPSQASGRITLQEPLHFHCPRLSAMPCPRCGCRLVSPASQGLVCTDCGHPMDDHLAREQPSWNWRQLGAAAAVVVIGLSAMALLLFSDALTGNELLEPDTPSGETERVAE